MLNRLRTRRYVVWRPADAIYLFHLQNLTDLLLGKPRFRTTVSTYPKLKLREREAGHSSPTSVNLQNKCNSTCTLLGPCGA
jgi:hypothetical protein